MIVSVDVGLLGEFEVQVEVFLGCKTIIFDMSSLVISAMHMCIEGWLNQNTNNMK
jgi:hypothetical protein